jgi:hypothetical protein
VGLIKNLVLVVLAFLFVTLLTTYLMLTSVKDNLLSADFYTGIFDRNGIYAKAQTMMLDSISGSQDLSNPLITQDEIKEIIKESITVPWMKNQSAQLIKGMVTYLTTDATRPDLTVSLKDVKPKIIASFNATLQEKFPAVQANRSYEEVLRNLLLKCGGIDQCTAYCQSNMTDEDCLAAAAITSDPQAQIALALPLLEAAIPDKYDAYQLMSMQDKAMLSNLKTYIKQFSLALTVMLGLAIVFAAIIVLVIGIGNLKSICKGMGIPLLFGGAGLIVTAVFTPGTVMKMIPAETFKAMGTANSAFVQNVLLDAMRTIFSSVMMDGMILAAVGLVLVVVSFFVGGGKAAQEPVTEKKKK